MKINDRSVAEAICPPGKKDVLLFDDTLPGFGLRVTAAGTKTFIHQYRVGAKVRRVSLGVFGQDLTATQARKKVGGLRGRVLDGHDPVADRKAARTAALAAEAEQKANEASSSFTVRRLIEQWAELHLAERSQSYRTRVPKQMKEALVDWLDVAAEALKQQDAIRALDEAKGTRGPVAANRLRAEARACWGWALKRGSLSSNPWAATARPSREQSRARVLSDWELADLWRASAEDQEPWTSIIQLLILTGQRRSEVSGMKWEEVDLEAGLWRLPGARTKNDHDHEVPLCAAAVAIIARQPKGDRKLVFSPTSNTPPSGFGRVKLRLDERMAEAAAEAKRKPAPWVLHDLRRTLATGLQRLGVRLEVTEAVLNHVSGSRAGIVGVYQRHGWAAEKAAALDAWAQHVLSLLEPKVDEKVVPLRRG